MKEIGTKNLILCLLTGGFLLLGNYFIPNKYHFLVVLVSFLCATISLLWWMVLYDQYDPEADVFGIGFSKRRLPVFIEHEGKMNAIAFNAYKWLVICIILIFS